MALRATAARDAAAVEKRRLAWELHKNRVSYENIARTTNPATGKPLYANRSGAHAAVKHELRRIQEETSETVEEARLDSMLLLKALQEQAARVAARPHPLIYRGKKVVIDGKTPNDDSIVLDAIMVMARLEDQMARRMGWDIPSKVEHSGPEGGAIPISVRAEELNERFGVAARLKALPPAGEST